MNRLFLVIAFLIMSFAAFGQSSVSASTTSNGQTASGQVNITWQPKLTLALSCPNSAQVSGTTQTCTATINEAAPAAGATVTLISSDTTKFTVPASVIIAPGATVASFVVTAQ